MRSVGVMMLRVDEHVSFCPILFFFFHLFCHFETDKNDFKLLWLSSHPLCGLAGNVALIIQCHLAEVGLFGINKQRAWKNYLRDKM